MSRLAVIMVLLAATGCGGPAGPAGRRADMPTAAQVVGLDLWAAPMAADVNGRPGVDGVSLRMMLQDAAHREPRVMADNDEITLLLFEGEPRVLDEATAFHVWRLTAEQMQPFLSRIYGLWCYELTMEWPGRVPTTPTVTVRARYRSAAGRVVQSAPATVKIR